MDREILTGSNIAPALKSVEPTRVAVAFIGRDWQEFLPQDLSVLECVVLAPVLGSNPAAIEDLAGLIGWDRVWLLPTLHAKLFLGKDSAVFGSANLTANGLAGNRLVELCVLTKRREELVSLHAFMDDVVAQAQAAFPTEQRKKEEVAALWDRVRQNPAYEGGFGNFKDKTFEDFRLLAPDQFYVSWFARDDAEYEFAQGMDQKVEDWFVLHPNDKIQEDKWVFFWQCDGDLQPLDERPMWMRVDALFPDECTSINGKRPVYTTMAAQLKRGRRTPPFKIDARVQRAFLHVCEDPKLLRRLQNDRLRKSTEALPDLITRMQAFLSP